jgi:hypothetical protein
VFDDGAAFFILDPGLDGEGGLFDLADGSLGGFDGDTVGEGEFGADDLCFDAGEDFEFHEAAAGEESEDDQQDGGESGDRGVPPVDEADEQGAIDVFDEAIERAGGRGRCKRGRSPGSRRLTAA